MTVLTTGGALPDSVVGDGWTMFSKTLLRDYVHRHGSW